MSDKHRVVLVVEDELLIRLCAIDVLVEEGFEVVEAEDAAAALRAANDYGHVDLLFTDVNMPGDMNGISLAEHLFALRPNLKVIITSALPLLRPVDHLQAHFLSKPYPVQGLRDAANGLVAA